MHEQRFLPRFIRKYPLWILLASAVLTVVLVAGIPRLTMRPFFEGDLPSNDPTLKANAKCASYFGKDDYAYLAVESDTIYRPSTLAKIVAITDELNTLDHVLEEQTLSLATVRKIKWRSWGLDVTKYLSPLPQTDQEAQHLREDIRLDSEIYSRLVSTDETSTLIGIKLSPGYDPTQLYHSLHAIADRYAGPEKIYPFGRQIMSEEANIGIARDARLLGPAALVLIAFGIFLFFRSIRLTLESMLMIVMSIAWAMGSLYYLGFRLSMLSSSIPAVLIALGSSYMIHVLNSCGEQARRVGGIEGVIEGVRRVARPVMLTAATSMVGFLTLLAFKILSIREFGICVAFGVGFAGLLSLMVLPSILVLQKGALSAQIPARFLFLDKMLNWFARIGIRHRYPVLGAGGIILILAITGIARIRVGHAPEEIFPKNHRAREVVALFINKFHGPYSFNVMFTTSAPDGLKSPDVLKYIDGFQEYAESLPKVTDANSIVNIVKRMNRILNEDNPKFYRVPETREMIAQLLLLHSLTQDPVQFESMVDYDIQRCKVVVNTTAIDSTELEEIYRELTAYCNEHKLPGLTAAFGGQSLVWMAQNQYIVTGKIINIISNTVLIWIICALAFRSVRLGFISIVPLSLATLMTFGLMGHLGIRLDTATAVLTGISVGVGVDFAIHFISRVREESRRTHLIDDAISAAMHGSGRAIVFDATSNILGFATFLFSGFTPVRTLGMLICLTMVSCVVLTLILIPTIIALVPVPFRHANGKVVILREEPAEETACTPGSE